MLVVGDRHPTPAERLDTHRHAQVIRQHRLQGSGRTQAGGEQAGVEQHHIVLHSQTAAEMRCAMACQRQHGSAGGIAVRRSRFLAVRRLRGTALQQHAQPVFLARADEQAGEPVVEHVEERRQRAVAQAVGLLHQFAVRLRQHAERSGQSHEGDAQVPPASLIRYRRHRRRGKCQPLHGLQPGRLASRRRVGPKPGKPKLGQPDGMRTVEAVRRRGQTRGQGFRQPHAVAGPHAPSEA